MNRLRDEEGDGPVAIRGRELLRGTPATPRMPEMKRRVWLAQQRPVARRAPGFPLSRLRFGVAVAGAILLIAGTSGAVIAARRWIVPALREVSLPTPKVASPATMAHGRARANTGLPSEAPHELDEPAGEAQAAPVGAAPSPSVGSDVTLARRALEREPSSSRGGRASRAKPARRTVAAPRPAPADISQRALESSTATETARERTQVLDAMVALRRDHDPVTAGAMLHRYLMSHPNGALREEALVLAIEAASARGDQATAKSLARTYQDLYPNGRFRRFAQDQAGAGGS